MIRRILAVVLAASLAASLSSCDLPGSPIGALESVSESVSESAGRARLVGWALDPDDPAGVAVVRLYVDGEPVADVPAGLDRPDVSTGVPASGTRHGFDSVVPLGPPGLHDVCAFAVNVERGGPMTLLGCQSLGGGSADPVGSVDLVALADGRLTFAGWALDADVTDPVAIEMRVNDRSGDTVLASGPRPDLATLFPGRGTDHGFVVSAPDSDSLVAPTYCFYAIDHADDTRRVPIGCRTRPVELTDVAGIMVSSAIADNVARMVFTAAFQGVSLSGEGYRDPQQQIRLRRQNCGTSPYSIWDAPSGSCSPPTARPGRSLHERGLAIDFRCSGAGIGSRSSPCFQWLAANAAGFGFFNLPSEPWHWSVNGN